MVECLIFTKDTSSLLLEFFCVNLSIQKRKKKKKRGKCFQNSLRYFEGLVGAYSYHLQSTWMFLKDSGNRMQ